MKVIATLILGSNKSSTKNSPFQNEICQYQKRMTSAIQATQFTLDCPFDKQYSKLNQFLKTHRKFKQIFLLDERGESFHSEQFSAIFFSDRADTLVILGDRDGFHPEVRKQFPRKISLSPLTLNRDHAELILWEQIYRSHCIQSGHPYHKDG